MYFYDVKELTGNPLEFQRAETKKKEIKNLKSKSEFSERSMEKK